MRRGVCLLRAGAYDQASQAFLRAGRVRNADRSLPAYLAACLVAKEEFSAAAQELAKLEESQTTQVSARVRFAYVLQAAGRPQEAINLLRNALRARPEAAELHFHLGTLLASQESYDEAELRFTQAVNLDQAHPDAFVSLAMCCAARGAAGEALTYLQKAQAMRPHDARIGLLLAQGARSMRQQGQVPAVRTVMPVEPAPLDPQGIAELSRVIEAEPDFVDAFLSLPLGAVDEQVFAMLLAVLQLALERQPEHAELHYHCGRVLSRLGRSREAIAATERAVTIHPRFVHALIELGRLYQQTDRLADATTRLEQAVAAGADFADVHFMLGNLYREHREIARARSAYRRALTLNEDYEEARVALQALPA